MEPMQAIKTVYNKYVTFSGRAQRSEFWWFMLFYFVVSIPMAFSEITDTLWSLGNLLPVLAVSCRRLHDTDRSGWKQLLPVLAVVPLALSVFGIWEVALIIAGIAAIGLYIVLIVWYASIGTTGPNRFGDDPLNPTDAHVFE